MRKQLFQSTSLRDAEQKCWRGICEQYPKLQDEHTSLETWGKGRRFGFVKISDSKLYWYAVVNNSLVDAKTKVADLFSEFNTTIKQIISNTPDDKIILTDIKDLQPLEKWHAGEACLIGDAAHATTPNMGQGACQAIEDAYVLGKLFETEKNVEDVFSKFEEIRRPKVKYIVNTSWKLGKISHWQSPNFMALRNWLLRNTPEKINNRMLERTFTIDKWD